MVNASSARAALTECSSAKNADSLEELTSRYSPLVWYVVNRLNVSLPTILDREDLRSYGTIGLLKAIARYDSKRGVKFETFAVHSIRGTIIDALRALDPVPRSVREKAKTIEAAVAELQQELGRPPRDQEVASRVGMSVEDLSRVVQCMNSAPLSLDQERDTPDGKEQAALVESLESTDSPNPAQAVELAELKAALLESIEHLTERERAVIRLCYWKEMTLRQISSLLGLSEARVCQLRAQALRQLRSEFEKRTIVIDS